MSLDTPPARRWCAAGRSFLPTLAIHSSAQEGVISRRGQLLPVTCRSHLELDHLGFWFPSSTHHSEDYVDMTHFVHRTVTKTLLLNQLVEPVAQLSS